MSAGGDLLQDTDLAREPVKEPAKRWRNWWRAGARATNGVCLWCGHQGAPVEPFHLYPDHCKVWPTREVAEQKAADMKGRHPRNLSVHEGAYPEGEKPHV